jgi:hypothetical protein
MGDHRRAHHVPPPYAGPRGGGHGQPVRPPVPRPAPRSRRVAPALVTGFSLALAPAAAGLALLLFPAAPDGAPPPKPLIQVVPRPAVAGTATPAPAAPPTPVIAE